jgi:hypothetical protein
MVSARRPARAAARKDPNEALRGLTYSTVTLFARLRG